MPPSRLEQLLGRLDRRVVYLGLFFATLVPLATGFSLPLYVTEPPQLFYRTVESLPPDRLVFVAGNWDAGTQAESRPQLQAMIRHLVRRNLKFVLFSIAYPTSPQLSETEVLAAIRAENAEERYQYGRDWVNLGYRINEDAWLRGLAQDISSAFSEDMRGTPIREIPLLRGVRRWGPDGHVSALLEVTGSSTTEKFYQFLSPTGVKFCLGCTAVMAPEQYPFLDSGQLHGLLTGMKGAAEYEKLLGVSAFGTRAMAGQSFTHLYILMLIVLGNIAVLMSRFGRR